MKRQSVLLMFLLMMGSLAFAQATQERPTISKIVDSQIKNVEGEFVPAAEAMPEDKFNFAPTNGEFKGVRTFAQEITHVAATNYVIAAGLLGEKAPADLPGPGENGPPSLKTKADIVKFLKDSFAQAHKAAATLTDQNATEQIPSPFDPTGKNKSSRLGLASVFAWHSMDHYGQMVEYLRMNGIVPPASRQQ